MGCAPSNASSTGAHLSRTNSLSAAMVCNNEHASTGAHGDNATRRESQEVTILKDDGSSFISRINMKTCWMNILLVFPKDDSQCEAFKKAADRGSYKYSIARSSERAVELFIESQHDLVVIDARHSKSVDYEPLCRSMKAVFPKGQTIFLAVMKKTGDKDEASILPLLEAGFNQRFMECTNTSVCLNELLSIERGAVRAQQQAQILSAMLVVMQNINESIEITDSKHRTEFVNKSFENFTRYNASEVFGQEIQEKMQVDNCNEEDTTTYHMQKGHVWDGPQSLRRKNGDTVYCKCKIIPVETAPGKVARHVVIRTPIVLDASIQSWDKVREPEGRLGGGLMHIRRRESITRIHSMTIEAPITKVINMIYETQASVPNANVVQALDKVLDILTTTDLYSPLIEQVKEEDPLANDLFGGLCDQPPISAIARSGPKQARLNTTLKSSSIYPTTPEVVKLLSDDACWSFDIIKLESLNEKRVLVPLGMKIFSRFNAFQQLGIDESCMANWLQLIGSNYRKNNPYHNATHAADVLQATAFFLDKMRPKKIFDEQDELAALIAAVIHDVDHPARTSSFLVNSRNKLAVLYNDSAVLENHHAAMGFFLTNKEEKSNILKNLEREEYENMRHTIIDMVLATEMAKHFEHLQKFLRICKTYAKSLDEDLSIKSGVTSMSDMVVNSPDNKRQILRMAIKCADVSNPARAHNLCETWARRIAEEYFQQTDEEREKKMPVVMPNFDRNTCSIPHSQLKFIEVFLLDMFDSWHAFLDIPEVNDQLQTNYKFWKEKDSAENPDSGTVADKTGD